LLPEERRSVQTWSYGDLLGFERGLSVSRTPLKQVVCGCYQVPRADEKTCAPYDVRCEVHIECAYPPVGWLVGVFDALASIRAINLADGSVCPMETVEIFVIIDVHECSLIDGLGDNAHQSHQWLSCQTVQGCVC